MIEVLNVAIMLQYLHVSDEQAIYLNFTQDDRSNIFNEKKPSVCSLKLAMAGMFTSQKLADATNPPSPKVDQ